MAEIKHIHNSNDTTGSMFLTASILMANMDYSGLASYAIKAAIGGAIWMAFKIAGDFITERIKKRNGKS